MPFVATNPLSQRLAVMERLWQEFRRLPGARLCRWLFAPGEAWFLDVFLEEQAGAEAVTNDIFVALVTPVHHWQGYFETALAQLAELVSHDTTLLAQRGIITPGDWGRKPTGQAQLPDFVGYVNRFAKALRNHTDGALVLCLLPQSCPNSTVLDQMLTALLQGGLSADVRLMVVDIQGAERLATFANRFKAEVYTTPVDLQLQKVTRQLAALGSPTAPDVKFRQWHAELTNALTQRNLRDVLYFASNCLLICQQERWYCLAGSVHLAVAQAYVDHHRYEEALSRYNSVLDDMEAEFQKGDEAAGRISLMAWLGAGGVYWELRQRPRAIEYYGRAGERAEALQEWLLALETHRRLGWAHNLEGRTRLSETHYQRLFELAGHLPVEQHPMARLPEIGRTYWQQQTTPEKRRQVDERLTPLLGADWRR